MEGVVWVRGMLVCDWDSPLSGRGLVEWRWCAIVRMRKGGLYGFLGGLDDLIGVRG